MPPRRPPIVGVSAAVSNFEFRVSSAAAGLFLVASLQIDPAAGLFLVAVSFQIDPAAGLLVVVSFLIVMVVLTLIGLPPPMLESLLIGE